MSVMAKGVPVFANRDRRYADSECMNRAQFGSATQGHSAVCTPYIKP